MGDMSQMTDEMSSDEFDMLANPNRGEDNVEEEEQRR
jgi:hypothetical protein